MLSIKNISFGYPNGEFILQNINFDVHPTEKVAILGANGAGKSSLARLISGLLPPTEGNIFIDGESIETLKKRHKLFPLIQITFQNPDEQIINFTVEREIAFGLENLAISQNEMVQRVDRTLNQFGLEKYRKTPPNQLSGGEKQKLCIASAMVMEPRFLVLDEPTAYLDPATQKQILSLIFNLQQKTGLILITGNLSKALQCDRIIVIKNKKIAFDGDVNAFLASDLWSYGIDIPVRFQLAKNLKEQGISVNFRDAISVEKLISYLEKLQ